MLLSLHPKVERPSKNGASFNEAGTYVDRYGREEGVFLSPVGTGFENRSLPARNIPSEYHVFKVIEDLSVNVGKILPWFGHPGNGIQFKLLDGETTISSKHMQKVR